MRTELEMEIHNGMSRNTKGTHEDAVLLIREHH